MPDITPGSAKPQRLLSLDFMRGLVMVLLALESCGLYEHLSKASEGSIFYPLARQFFHHPWHGLHVWDLVQPAFMFMAGAAMAFSLQRQRQQGMSWGQSFQKALARSGWLFFWGVLDYAVRPSGLSFELWDVLTQLSFTSLLAFLIFQWSAKAQIAFCAGLLLITELLYRFTHVPGFDKPFTDQHNFGNYIDLLLMNKINPGGWVAINCIPTAVHTIAGALAGKLLLSARRENPATSSPLASPTTQNSLATPGPVNPLAPLGPGSATKPVSTLLGWGLVALIVGYGLDLAGITPIIKRIATSSFTLVSLGWSLWVLALCYWWIDVRDHRRRLQFFTIVGMNSIFIYLFFEIVGDRWFTGYAAEITNGLMKMVNTPNLVMGIVSSLVLFGFEWSLCYFLYRKKIFFRV
jgi:predicted acyltransferase